MKRFGIILAALVGCFFTFWAAATLGALVLYLLGMSVHGYGVGAVVLGALTLALYVLVTIIRGLNNRFL